MLAHRWRIAAISVSVGVIFKFGVAHCPDMDHAGKEVIRKRQAGSRFAMRVHTKQSDHDTARDVAKVERDDRFKLLHLWIELQGHHNQAR